MSPEVTTEVEVADNLFLFTVEANGEPIAVVASSDPGGAKRIAEAQTSFGEETDREGEADVGGAPEIGDWVYLGTCEQGAAISVRAASDSEEERWHAAVQRGREEGEIEDDDDLEGYTVFLVPVSDPAGDEEYDWQA